MTSRFDTCLAETLHWEGGWSDDPHDPGGPTNKGIILAVFAAWRGVTLTPETRDGLIADLRAISAREVAEIYRRQYWDAMRCDDLPPPLDLAVFDFGVNSGVSRAIKHLQRALGVTADGHFGAATMAAVQCSDPAAIAAAVIESRRTFLRQIPHFWRFGKGWLRRCDGIEAACTAIAAPRRPLATVIRDWPAEVTPARIPVRPSHAEPLPDPDAQSATQARATAPDTQSMGQSSTARAAEAAGGLSGAQLGVEVASAASRARTGATSLFDGLLMFVLALAQSPTFWIAVGMFASAAYVWLERRRRLALG